MDMATAKQSAYELVLAQEREYKEKEAQRNEVVKQVSKKAADFFLDLIKNGKAGGEDIRSWHQMSLMAELGFDVYPPGYNQVHSGPIR